MAELLCPHCLQPLPGGYGGDCPHCGRSLQNQNPEGALPLGTQLAGRYTVGAYLSADGDGLAYRGVLNEEKRFVLIKEYFPVTLCNGRSADGALMPGMVCRVTMESDSSARAIVLPNRAVQVTGRGERFVWCVRDGRAALVPVTVGALTETGVVVTGGLAGGEQVIVDGYQKVSDGMNVDVL